MMPGHFHGKFRATITAEKFVEFYPAMVELLVGRLDVERVFTETLRGFVGVAFVPAIRDGLHEPVEFISRNFHGLRHGIFLTHLYFNLQGLCELGSAPASLKFSVFVYCI